VADLAEAVAARLGLPREEQRAARHAGELHDVGKVAIPDAILAKPGPLDQQEWTFMREHTVVGERIVAADPALAAIGRLVRSSHERWDGGGYPDGLAGTAIPLVSRIVAVCDAWDAMASHRPYRPARGPQDAEAELLAGAGSQFDPVVVEAFLAVRRASRDHVAPLAA
jgi:HD-GYP domain-containing protein (c-di-GMP phosphodiesterase class II)